MKQLAWPEYGDETASHSFWIECLMIVFTIEIGVHWWPFSLFYPNLQLTLFRPYLILDSLMRARLFCQFFLVLVLLSLTLEGSMASGQTSPLDTGNRLQVNTTEKLGDKLQVMATILERKDAKQQFGSWVADNFLIVSLSIKDSDVREKFVLAGISLDVSNWRLGPNVMPDTGTDKALPTSKQMPSSQPTEIRSEGAQQVRSGSASAAPFSVRNVVVDGLLLVGAATGGYSIVASTDFLRSAAIYSGLFVPGVSKAWPDNRSEHEANILIRGFQDQKVVDKNTALLTFAFFPIGTLAPPRMRKFYLRHPELLLHPGEVFIDSRLAKQRDVVQFRRDISKVVAAEGIPDDEIVDDIKSSCRQGRFDAKSNPKGERACPYEVGSPRLIRIHKLQEFLSASHPTIGVKGYWAVDVEDIPPSIASVAFDQESDGPELWSDIKDEHAGVVRGSHLLSGVLKITAISVPGIANPVLSDYVDSNAVALVKQNSGDTELHFKTRFKQEIPIGTKLTFQVTKNGTEPIEGLPYLYAVACSPMAFASKPEGPGNTEKPAVERVVPVVNPPSGEGPTCPKCPECHKCPSVPEPVETVGTTGDLSAKPEVNGRRFFVPRAVQKGDRFSTGAGGFLELTLMDGVSLRLSENTEVRINGKPAPSTAVATLLRGTVLVRVSKRPDSSSPVIIDTPVVRVKDNGTIYSLTTLPDSSLIVCIECIRDALRLFSLDGAELGKTGTGEITTVASQVTGEPKATTVTVSDVLNEAYNVEVKLKTDNEINLRSVEDCEKQHQPESDCVNAVPWNTPSELHIKFLPTAELEGKQADNARASWLCDQFVPNHPKLCHDAHIDDSIVKVSVTVPPGDDKEYTAGRVVFDSPQTIDSDVPWKWTYVARKLCGGCLEIRVTTSSWVDLYPSNLGQNIPGKPKDYKFKVNPTLSPTGVSKWFSDLVIGILSMAFTALLGVMIIRSSAALNRMARERKWPKVVVVATALLDDTINRMIESRKDEGGAKDGKSEAGTG